MKKVGIIILLIGGTRVCVFAQLPVSHATDVPNFSLEMNILSSGQINESTEIPSAQLLESSGTETGVVIIDDDELGISVAPNPANTHITFSSTQDLIGSTITIIDAFGKLVIQQALTSTTISVKDFSNGIFYFFFTDNKNQLIGEGSFAVQH